VKDEAMFWVLVDLIPEQPEFYVVPNSWMESALHDEYQAYLNRHGGRRPVNPTSKHIGFSTGLIEAWRDRWDLLGILPNAGAG